MQVIKQSLLIQFTTQPANGQVSAAHSGGWSEQIWFTGPPNTVRQAQNFAVQRAPMLPKECSIVGLRQQIYTLVSPNLTPGGAQTIPLNVPGNVALSLNDPQATLNIALASNGIPNVGRYNLRGLPDEVAVGGEYNGDARFAFVLNVFTQYLTSYTYGFVGRTLTGPAASVLSSAGAIVQVDSSAGFAANQMVRFVKVRDINGASVSGVFQIAGVPDATHITLANAPQVPLAKGGKMRVNGIQFCPANQASVGRLRSHKVGRPFAGYRGRRSKHRAA